VGGGRERAGEKPGKDPGKVLGNEAFRHRTLRRLTAEQPARPALVAMEKSRIN
jgi:hypothetical protein